MRPIIHAFLLIPLLIASALRAQPSAIDKDQPWRPPRYLLTYDTDISSRAGADNLLGAYYLITGWEDRLLPPRWNEENRFLTKAGGIGYRLAKLSLVDYPLLSVYPEVFQHEVFGHGYRAREFGCKNIEYSFPGPFLGGSAHTRFYWGSQRPTWDMDIAMAMGGVEASSILAERLKKDWLQSGSMEYHGALLYLSAFGDLAAYISITDEKDLEGTPNLGNDMLHYLYSVNHKAGDTVLADYKLRLKDMKQYAGANALDPYYWFAVWTILKTHLWSGQSRFRNPALRLGPVRYLPGFGSILNPWGPEFRFENLLSWDRRTVIARYRIGDDAYRRNWGLDLETSELFSYAGATLDADFHFWKQPRLILERSDTGTTESRLGFGQSLTVFLPPFVKRIPVRLAIGGEYKTSGFVPGRMLDEGFTARVSAAWFP